METKLKGKFKKGQVIVSDDFGKGNVSKVKRNGIIVDFNGDEIFISYESMEEDEQ